MNQKLKVVTKNKIPEYATKYSCGLDLYTSNLEDIVIKPNETVMLPTDLKVEIPEGYFGAIYPRSSTGVKRKLALTNTIGIIDSDYRGEIMLAIYNFGENEQIIKHNDRLVQMVIQKYEKLEVESVETLSDTERNVGGFGSTGR
ncbi:MAG: dUTP diphosphatase [Peptoniphilaceae bacterium]|nr:dUTP diphosphatase [Peptoniphilaceae bacterium]MDD7382825.1 dUTP diphosphatase [Peptoniphilaceae bacterium]MDY3738216.1 dUTP diphosphatase [Peptoniphilaceae bacterium]